MRVRFAPERFLERTQALYDELFERAPAGDR